MTGKSSVNPPRSEQKFLRIIQQFGAELGPRIRGDGRNEDRLRSPVSRLVERLGDHFGFTLVVHDEVTLSELRSRPDLAIDALGGRIGYIELKAPGKGTPANWRPTNHDRNQWSKLQSLPNLIYTDGNSWALYRNGELVGRVGKLVGDLGRAGRKLAPADRAFEELILAFLQWRPKEPRTLKAVVADVAPLCRLLREQVVETLAVERTQGKKPFTTLALEWTNILFPSPSPDDTEDQANLRFADSYAQAVTFGLLLAKVDGVSFEGRSPAGIAEQLAKQHSLLGESLAILANPKWVSHLNVVDTLLRVIGNINWANVQTGKADTYAKLYENFLDEYDPALRRRSGTYYTPVRVARAMVTFVNKVLKDHLRKDRGFAASDVYTLDPSMGAGTFLAEVLQNAAQTLKDERQSEVTPGSHLRELFAERLIGFEIQAAPFAVAELRLHAALRNIHKVEIPAEEPRFLTDTLDDPYLMTLQLGQLYEALMETRERANQVKRTVPVMVVIGNPPWRERARGAAKWIERRRTRSDGADSRDRPSMDEFRAPGTSRLAFNLNNMWTYFWRWSAWKAFEANEPAGIVALITPSAYLTSASYAGMRQYLRKTADVGWIIDLSPEQHRSDVRTRIFPETQHAICIGIFARSGARNTGNPAEVHYAALSGSQEDKFSALEALSPESHVWQKCTDSWRGPFRPEDKNWTGHPSIGDIFPWHSTGVNSNRNWVWAPDRETLMRRWRRLIRADAQVKPDLFKETRDRKIDSRIANGSRDHTPCRPLSEEGSLDNKTVDVMFRSFDRQQLIYDRRVIDFPRLELWQTQSDKQVYICEQHAHELSSGPGLIFSALVPNVHCFNGRGGRTMPLYRNQAGTSVNMPPALPNALSDHIGCPISAEDVLAYIAGVVAHSGYTARFAQELKNPGIRVPITLDPNLWKEAVKLGETVLWLHSYGTRCVNSRDGRPLHLGRKRRASYTTPVPSGDDQLLDSEISGGNRDFDHRH